MTRALQIAAAVAIGVLLRFIVGLNPVWWLVWVAPVPLLVLAFRLGKQDARWMVTLAAVIGVTSNFHYLRLVMPLPMVIAVVVGQAWLWVFIVLATRRLVVRYKTWWAAFSYPVLWAAMDTLMASLLPDGDWASLAYSQSDILPVLQVTSLFGVPGLLFLITLVPSTLALAIAYGRGLRNGWIAYATATLLLVASVSYGVMRLQRPVKGSETAFGLVAVDDAIGLKASAGYASNILRKYDQQVASLAVRGAAVIVLPEKVAMLTPLSAQQWQEHLGGLAAQGRIWLEAGVGIDDGKGRVNLAWLFTPDGKLAASYQKHHMAPGERREKYVSGADYAVHSINGQNYGLAICKDMHFAALGRAYGSREAAVMLVPAWDYGYFDAWMEARTTVTRGVENGYAVVRSSREGLLTVSDPYGRVVAERESSAMPGSSLLARLNVADRVPTLYTRIGGLFGWTCVVVSGVFLLMGRRGAGPVPVD
jgi:apolipoprotein N-acyltransferase